MNADPFGGIAADGYCANDIAFALPDLRWVDQTVHELDARTGGERTCTLVMYRTRLEPGDDLDALVTRSLQRAGREKRQHEILRRTEREIAGRPGIDLAVRWRGERSHIYTRQAHLTAAGLWLVFGINGWLEDADICDAHLEHLLATLRLRPETTEQHHG